MCTVLRFIGPFHGNFITITLLRLKWHREDSRSEIYAKNIYKLMPPFIDFDVEIVRLASNISTSINTFVA